MILTINNKRFQHFISYTIDLKYNSFAHTFSFTGKKNFFPRPTSYPECTIETNDGELLITGTILIPNKNIESKPGLKRVSGYSKPGVLEDTSIPISLYPLQSDNRSLRQITDRILKKFDVEFLATSNVATVMDKKYVKTVASVGQSPKQYINSLASQRGVLITNDNQGRLLFTQVDTSRLKPVAQFIQGQSNVDNMAIASDGQRLHSNITVFRQATRDNPDAGQKSINNPFVDVFRPLVLVLNSGDIFDLEAAARNALSVELTNIRLTISTKTFVQPGNLVTVKAPDLDINNDTDFFVESTRINGNNITERYVLNCVLDTVYSNDEVINIFE